MRAGEEDDGKDDMQLKEAPSGIVGESVSAGCDRAEAAGTNVGAGTSGDRGGEAYRGVRTESIRPERICGAIGIKQSP